VAGLLTFSGGLFALVLALLRGNDWGWTSGRVIGLLVAAVVLLAGFAFAELRQAQPMFDLRLFRIPAFTGAQVTAFALSAASFSMLLYLTLYIQNVLGYSPIAAGVIFLPWTLLSFAVAPISGRLSARAPVNLLLGGGLALVSLGLFLMHGIGVGSGWTTLLPGFICNGAGVGLVNPPLASTAVGVVPARRSGMASGVNNTFRQVGIATGIAALGALFQHHIADALGPRRGLAQAVSSGSFGRAVHGHAAELAARAAFVGGLNEILLVATGVAAVGAVCAFLLVRHVDLAQERESEPERMAA
jgi:predicted MFS family arabinose efflux permease